MQRDLISRLAGLGAYLGFLWNALEPPALGPQCWLAWANGQGSGFKLPWCLEGVAQRADGWKATTSRLRRARASPHLGKKVLGSGHHRSKWQNIGRLSYVPFPKGPLTGPRWAGLTSLGVGLARKWALVKSVGFRLPTAPCQLARE